MILIKNGTIITLDAANRIIKGSLLINDNQIQTIGHVKTPAEITIDAEGKLIIPGMICAHSHMYGALARGMPLNRLSPKNFIEILENIWWRLDKKLTLKDVKISAELCLLEMIKSGITSFVEHHSSPQIITNSLTTIARVVEKAGLRGLLSYEVTDREGPIVTRKGIEENEQFIKKARGRLKGNFGLHASMTLSDETIQRCLDVVNKYNVGFHLHVAESSYEVKYSIKNYGKRPVERLNDLGVLTPNTIAAHCVHVNEKEIELLRKTNTNIVHNPQSNMNNAVGIAPIPEMMNAGINIGLGTDGYCFNMFKEANVMYLLHKLSKNDPRVLPADLVIRSLFYNNAKITGFDVGSIEVGKLADLVILNYKPPTPLTPENFPWHFIFGMNPSQIETVLVDGKIIMQNREVITLKEDTIVHESKKAASDLWKRLLKAS